MHILILDFNGTRATAIFRRNGTHGSGYFKQLLSALAATLKTHLHARVSSDRDSAVYAGSYLSPLCPLLINVSPPGRMCSVLPPCNYRNLDIYVVPRQAVKLEATPSFLQFPSTRALIARNLLTLFNFLLHALLN